MCLFSGLGVVGPSITIWLENYLDFAIIPVSIHSVSIKVCNWVDHELLTITNDPLHELGESKKLEVQEAKELEVQDAKEVEAKEVEAKEVDATLAKELEVHVLDATLAKELDATLAKGPESKAGCGYAWNIA